MRWVSLRGGSWRLSPERERALSSPRFHRSGCCRSVDEHVNAGKKPLDQLGRGWNVSRFELAAEMSAASAPAVRSLDIYSRGNGIVCFPRYSSTRNGIVCLSFSICQLILRIFIGGCPRWLSRYISRSAQTQK